ncbi:cysteine synthase A [Clostridium kluyveri]|uniref:Cysteine synthase n=1 Tax=Clostridium kluyveri TaxID=1534 RepID=A0A1L5FCH4_CLOKL|nr:cysteine synthase A [Clostridium kluyveri]APM40719.1 cysteine synthase A [Clostridium kluyveri]
MIFNNAIDMIGATPLFKLDNFKNKDSAEIYVKLEKYNPGGSIKDRAALGMIEEAEKDGLIEKGGTIVEPTSGNTGIALAMIGKLKGYKVIIVMPETMSVERRNMIKAYGAELILTDGTKGMKGAIEKAYEIAKNKRGYYIPQQFINKANPKKHYETTAEEILEDLQHVDAFVAGVGTAGTLAGVGENLKGRDKNVKIIAVEPASSPVLSGGQTGAHKIQGIGAGFVPDIYIPELVDKIITITDETAFKYARLMGKEEGILVGISSGANIAAAIQVAEELGNGKKVVTVAPDGGEKYLSMGLYD